MEYPTARGREEEAVHTIREDTIRRINQGDAKAFEQLYNSYSVYLSAVGRLPSKCRAIFLLYRYSLQR